MSTENPQIVTTPDEFQSGLDDRWAQAAADQYQRRIEAIAARLHDIAAEVQREGVARVGHVNADGKPDYLWSAQQVLHTVTWGVANLNLDGLLSTAADAQNAVRGRDK